MGVVDASAIRLHPPNVYFFKKYKTRKRIEISVLVVPQNNKELFTISHPTSILFILYQAVR